ncbi:dermatopontin-like [Oculina patagonica]
MTGRKLVVFILLIVSMELFFGSVDSKWWRRRRRRRRSPPPPPPPTTPPCKSTVPYPGIINWHNKWHQSFSAYCPYSYSMAQWLSVFRLCQEDRIHHFRCSFGPAIFDHSNCGWTSQFVNDVKKTFIFKCPSQGFINGIGSYFDKTSKDRRFKFRCCHVNGYQRSNCKTTPYMNQYGGLLNYIVAQGYTLVGVISKHSVEEPSKNFSDRIWRFEYCQVKRQNGKK